LNLAGALFKPSKMSDLECGVFKRDAILMGASNVQEKDWT